MCRCLFPAVLLVGAALVPARADEPPPATQPVEAVADTYLNESLEAREALSAAGSLAEVQQWSQAARTLQEASRSHGDTLVRAGPALYIPVRLAVSRTVALWPPAGLAAYRALYEDEARQGLERAGVRFDLPALLDLFDEYFCTESGVATGETAAELALSSGEFALAQSIYRRLLDLHPDRASLRETMAPRLAVTLALMGQSEAARQTVEEVQDGASNVRWLGNVQPLASVVEQCLSAFRPQTAAEHAFDWPAYGGGPARDRAVAFDPDDLGLLFHASGGSDAATEDINHDSAASVAFPIVTDGRLTVADGSSVWAADARTGRLLWRYRGVPADFAESWGSLRRSVPWSAPCAAGDRVYAVIHAEPDIGWGVGLERPHVSRLVCLHADDGRELWRADGADLAEGFVEVRFDGAPLVTGGNVYVVVRRQRSFGFEDAILCRFDAETGRRMSRAHLCGASTGEYGRQRNTTSIPSLVDGVLYVESSLGVVAAVCPHRGKVRWVHAYDTLSRREWGRGQGARAEVAGGWQFNPVFAVPDRLIALPLDCESLLVLDRSDGGLVRSVPRSELADARAVVSVRGSRLYGLGAAGAFCYDLAEAALMWTAPWPAEAEITGYAALTETELLIPTSAGLCRVDLAAGDLKSVAWDEGLGGNLLPMPDQLVVAAFDGVRVYARRADVWARHEAEFHARPQDPGAALDLADVAFRLGRDGEGAAAVEEAVRRAGGFAGPMRADVKRRLFEDSLRFAARLQSREGVDPVVLSRLFAVATETPPDVDAHGRRRLTQAAWDESAGRIREAVALYQQVIADRSLREHVSAASEPAGELARRHVARLMEWHGPDVYAACEREARELLAAADRTGEVGLLDRVTDTYPNSQAAGVALVEKGRRLAGQGDATGAAEAFRAALARYATTVDTPAVIRALADAYVQDGRHESAFRWMVRGARQFPLYRFEVDGERLDFAVCRDRLHAQWGPLEPPRPALGPPLIALAPRTFLSELTLLAPRFTDTRRASWRQYYVFVESGIQAFGAGNQPVWPTPAPCRMAPELLLATDDVAVVATRHQVLAVDASTGTVRWSYGVYPADLLDPNTDHEQFTEFRAFGYGNDRLVCVQEDGQTVCLDVRDGRVVWRRQIEGEAVGDVNMSEAWVIVRAARLGRPVLEVLDAQTGDRGRQLRPPVNEVVVASALSLDGKAIAVTPRNLCAFDVSSGQLLWQRRLDRVVLPATVCADVDGLCFATASGLLEKVSLDNGRPIWSAPSPVRGAFDAPRAHLVDGRLLLTSERQVCEVDNLDGRLLWELSGVERPNFQDRFVAERHVVAVHWPGRARREGFKAYFFDLAEGGRPAAVGGVLELGEFERVRRTVLCDVGLVLQEGNTLHVWAP